MKFDIDRGYLLDTFRTIVETPSPVGFYVKMNPLLQRLAGEMGHAVTFDNRSTAYLTLEGEDNTKTVLIGAHADTLGMCVRCIEGDGMLKIRRLAGSNFATLEGETVTIHTRDGREYTGLVICRSHSSHVFADANTLERNEDTLRILIDEPVKSRADVQALGIQNGDVISVMPRPQFTENGYVKSRYIDDKGAIACVFAMLRYLHEHGLKPKYRTILAFPYSEEISMGGTYVPPEVSEYIAVDIGLIGPELSGHERAVSICAKDAAAPYDWELTNRLVEYAKKAEVPYALDVFYRYGTDGNAAVRAGNNVRSAAFGMAVWASHGMERTHIDGLAATTNLLLAYILDI